MSEPNQEPTMEEILASIRRIISEDEAPPAEAEAAPAEEAPAAAAPEPEPEPEAPVIQSEPEPEPVMAQAEEDDVLELTERVETHGDIEVHPAPEPVAARAPEPAPAPAPAAVRDEEPLLGPTAGAAIASAFGHLHQTVAMPRDGQTLDGVVKELLRPLLKAWLDEHLPAIVQAKVEEEVERAARGPRR
jgi:cell pole-organizing protein PopZ